MLNKIIQLIFSQVNKVGIKLSAVFVVAGILGYLNQLLIARLLDITSYGIFATFLSVLAIISSPSILVSNIVIKQVSKINTNNGISNLIILYKNYILIFILFLLISQCTILFFGKEISTITNLDQNVIYIIFLISFFLILKSISTGIFYGIQKFNTAGLIIVLYPILKILFCFVLIHIGTNEVGAILGYLFAGLIIFLYCIYLITNLSIPKDLNLNKTKNLKLNIVIKILISNFLFAIMLNMDVIIINSYFGSEEAALYATSSVLGKSVLYLPGGIAIALLSINGGTEINNNHHFNNLKSLFYSFSLTVFCCLFLSYIIYIYAEQIITLTFGDNYRNGFILLKYYIFGIFPWALVIVLESYLIATEKYLIMWIYFFGLILQVFLLYFFLSDILSVIYIMCLTGFIILILCLFYLIKKLKN